MLLYACRRQRLVNGILFLVTIIFLLTADARIVRAEGNGNDTVAIRFRRAGSFPAKQFIRFFYTLSKQSSDSKVLSTPTKLSILRSFFKNDMYHLVKHLIVLF